MGAWGWSRADGALRFVFALGAPLVWAILWGTFAVPGDPSRSGKAPVPVPGLLRLLFELGFFAFGVWSLDEIGAAPLALILGLVVLVHYAVSYDRVSWLIRQSAQR